MEHKQLGVSPLPRRGELVVVVCDVSVDFV